MKIRFLLITFLTFIQLTAIYSQEKLFSKIPTDAIFHTEDIIRFWEIFDRTYPKLSSKEFQENYINRGSKGLKGFIKYRIQSGKHLKKIVNKNIDYYLLLKESSLSISNKKEKIYECFQNLKKIYPEAVFPDVYFVIGAKNSGGTIFSDGLIIGAEMFGIPNDKIQYPLNIDLVDELVSHELIHFQQRYNNDNSLLAQCIIEGSADFLCELIAGGHSNTVIYKYGYLHEKELYEIFLKDKNNDKYSFWLYGNNDKTKPNDLGYWIGYQITKSYYDKSIDKSQAIYDILNIKDFQKFYTESGYQGPK